MSEFQKEGFEISMLSIGQAKKLHPDKYEESLKEEIQQFND